jgi:hypothetical protein
MVDYFRKIVTAEAGECLVLNKSRNRGFFLPELPHYYYVAVITIQLDGIVWDSHNTKQK